MNSKKIIAVIGGGDFPQDSEKYILGRRLGKALVDNDYRVLTGGMFGIMEAAARGARESDKYFDGAIIAIAPYRDQTKLNAFNDIIIPTGFHGCTSAIISSSDAIVAIGGGAGTLSEIAMGWMMDRMIIGYDVEGWSGRVAGMRIDPRNRIDWPEDKVFKVSTESEVIHLLKTGLMHYQA